MPRQLFYARPLKPHNPEPHSLSPLFFLNPSPGYFITFKVLSFLSLQGVSVFVFSASTFVHISCVAACFSEFDQPTCLPNWKIVKGNKQMEDGG